MNIFLIIQAVFFAALGLAIIGFVFKIILSAFVGSPLGWSPWGWLEKTRFAKKVSLLRQANAVENENNLEKILSLLRSALFLDSIKHKASLIHDSTNHNMDILEKLVYLSEKRGTHIANLAVIEDLIATRQELLKVYFDTRQTIANLKKREKNPEKASSKPKSTWAVTEFAKKSSEIGIKLDENKKMLIDQFDKASKSFQNFQASNEITYH
jgi:hypothetical protein